MAPSLDAAYGANLGGRTMPVTNMTVIPPITQADVNRLAASPNVRDRALALLILQGATQTSVLNQILAEQEATMGELDTDVSTLMTQMTAQASLDQQIETDLTAALAQIPAAQDDANVQQLLSSLQQSNATKQTLITQYQNATGTQVSQGATGGAAGTSGAAASSGAPAGTASGASTTGTVGAPASGNGSGVDAVS